MFQEVLSNGLPKSHVIAYTTACTYWKKFDIRFAGFEDSASLNGSSVKSDSSDVAE